MNSNFYGFIGAGRMATALAGGIVAGKLARADQIIASDPLEEVRGRFADAVPGAQVTSNNGQVAELANVLVLAVKPQILPTALADLNSAITPRHLVVSIAAGTPLKRLADQLPPGTRLVRVMPNTPCLVSHGASGYSLGEHATKDDTQLVASLLKSVGIAIELPENLLDAVTGLSGSGPAFVYTMIEALSDGGVLAGLPRPVAQQLAVQTVAGAAAMVRDTGLHPAELRDAVTSPGGTTIAGLEALEREGMRVAVVAAVKAATGRSQELGGA